MNYSSNAITWVKKNTYSEKEIEEKFKAQGKIVLKSALSFPIMDLADIMITVQNMLPELSDYINQFHNTVTNSNINVMTDPTGKMSWTPPSGMANGEFTDINRRLTILDRAIDFKIRAIESKLAQSNKEEIVLMAKGGYDPNNYPCSILEQERDLEILKSYYKKRY